MLGLASTARLKEHEPGPERVLHPVKGLGNQGTEQDRTHHPQTAAWKSRDTSAPHKGRSRGQESHELMGKEGFERKEGAIYKQ